MNFVLKTNIWNIFSAILDLNILLQFIKQLNVFCVVYFVFHAEGVCGGNNSTNTARQLNVVKCKLQLCALLNAFGSAVWMKPNPTAMAKFCLSLGI